MDGASMVNMLRDPNPLFMKSLRSRMRGMHLLSWGVVTVTMTTFVCLLIYFIQTKQLNVSSANAAKSVIPAILIIQSFLLMFFGTGAVAYGISQERDEGLVDYQRMTPMSPTAKTLGYLFGLPAREYALVAMTMPFLIVAVVMSGFSVVTLGHFYLVFFLSVWVYHMTGLTAGMVSPMPRMAAMVSMVMVAVLYFVLPNLSRIGLPFFEHLTIRPMLLGMIYDELPTNFRPPAEVSGIDRARPIPWFGGAMNQTVYTVLSMGFMIGVMFSVVRRKWVRENSHLFSKVGGLVVYGGALVFLLASLWSIVSQDDVYRGIFGPRFNGVELMRDEAGQLMRGVDGRVLRVSNNPNDIVVEREPELLMVLLMISSALIGSMYLLMTTWITAGRHTAIEGWRRAKKHNNRWLNWNSDAASSLPACGAMIAMSAASGAAVLMLATEQQGFYVKGPSWDGMLLAGVAIVAAGLFVQGACEWMSGRVFGVAMFLMWMIPFFAAIIMEAAFEMYEAGLLVSMPCPPVMMLSAISVMMDTITVAPGVQTELVLPNDQYPNFVQITRIGVYGYLGLGVAAQAWRWWHRVKIRRVGMGDEAPGVTRLASGLPGEGAGSGVNA